MSERPSVTELEIKLLLLAIYDRFHYDFRNYSTASLKRRLAAALVQLGCPTISALQDKLIHQPTVFGELLQYLTVQVSDLFRDPPFFRSFRERIVPELRTYPSVKLWVAGCSSGEEVYSFAIVLAEEGLLERTIVYATDINPEALAKAESGVYALDRMSSFSLNYQQAGGRRSLSDYCTTGYDAAVFSRQLRSKVVFSDHSLATDSVFAEVHVVACRNVLIYFDRELQARAVKLFADSLCRRGFLGLGSRESLQFSPQARLFCEFVKEDRWYQK